ncbi:MAG: protein-glutamate O-methyltransferase family protein [Cyclobacteriaceae bacterium]|nr:protein-glutamate O-methyltransferase family protein [Cyclobacteriaceae bacterium]
MDNKEFIYTFEPINACDGESFASFTLRHRFPAIIDNISHQFALDGQIKHGLEWIKSLVAGASVSEGLFCLGSDRDQWNEWAGTYRGLSWFEMPFYAAEAFLYRLILEKSGFFTTGIDPFHRQKARDIQQNLLLCHDMLSLIGNLEAQRDCRPLVRALLEISLWGNRSDLSQLTMNRDKPGNQSGEYIIIDHSEAIADLICRGLSRIDLILDNAGLELFSDLLLARELVHSGLVNEVTLHAKAYPTFVSDATLADIRFLLDTLRESAMPSLKDFADSIDSMLATTQMRVVADPFWNSPLHFYQMPSSLTHGLRLSDCLIFKGDANYRRLFGDRKLPVDIDPALLTGYLPATGVAIRTLKSEIVSGLPAALKATLDASDKEWMVNGKYGLLQVLRRSAGM